MPYVQQAQQFNYQQQQVSDSYPIFIQQPQQQKVSQKKGFAL
jgi:hypothetical protein